MDIWDDNYEDHCLIGSGNEWRLIRYDGVADQSEWPKADSSKVCLFEATTLVGRRMFGIEWTGEELLVRMGVPDPEFRQLSADQVQRFEDNMAAQRRLKQVAEWIAQRCRDGELSTYYRYCRGGALFEMAPHEWNIERPLANFWVFGGHDRRVPDNARRFSEQVYVFAGRDTLLKAASTIIGTRTTHEAAVQWCHRWMEDGNGSGMDKAWPAFRAEPAHHGLSRDDFFRPACLEAKRRK